MSTTRTAQRKATLEHEPLAEPHQHGADEHAIDAVPPLEAAASPALFHGTPPPAQRMLRQTAVDQFQQTHGNGFVNRLLRPAQSPALQRMLIQRDDDVIDNASDVSGLMTRQLQLRNHHPSTNIGIFNADYSPGAGAMTVTSKLFFDFQNGNPADPTFVATVGGPVAAAAFTPDQFTWTPEESQAWQDQAMSDVESVWSGQHSFHCTSAGFEALPNVQITVDAVVTARREDAHYVIAVKKWPTEPGLTEFMTDPADRDTHSSTGELHESGDNGITNPDQSHFVRNTGTRAGYGIVDTNNPEQVFFTVNSSTLEGSNLAAVQLLGQTLGRAEIPPFNVTVTGHASADGQIDPNMALSEARATAVSNELVRSGAKRQPTAQGVGETGASPTPEWRRADIAIGNFESDQRTMVHEFGHIIGLDDEYPAADGAASRTVGTEVGHSDLAESLIPGQQPVVAHHNENVMSNGEVIRPHHYVTFLEALNKMTGDRLTWEVGPGRGRPTGPGDFPTPTDDGTATA